MAIQNAMALTWGPKPPCHASNSKKRPSCIKSGMSQGSGPKFHMGGETSNMAGGNMEYTMVLSRCMDPMENKW